MNKKYLIICSVFVLIASTLRAQGNNDSKKNNIIETLISTDSISKASVKVYQDKRIDALLVNKRIAAQIQTANGFRVQVFSGSVQKTAKTEAFRIEKLIQEIFPEQPVYVNYTSPFWKVRVGDFKAKNEAQIFKDKVVESFPAMKSEIYTVPEQIIISTSK
jgi:hypothetical protein